MYKLLTLFLALSFTCVSNGQVVVPQNARIDLQSRYEKIENVKWQVDRFGIQARFECEDQDQKVIYSKSGTWLETISNIPFSGLTENVRNFLKSRYQDYQIKEVKMIETKDFFGFEVKIRAKNLEKVILLSDNTLIVIEE